ncbi:MAG TPA: FkbM family methyltransferase [Afifellaceae bacterium]|nr:FkbM family methyltransferase [Afifellaceae bacterium]
MPHLWNEYFVKEKYKFVAGSETPLIIDAGAHIGLSVLYWKSLFPKARIIAFEPDPANFAALKANCADLSGVELHNAAVWCYAGDAAFTQVGSVGGFLSTLAADGSDPQLHVRTVSLRDFLQEPVDLLKLDIEGAEIDVLLYCADRLENVEQLFVEYHSFIDRPQRLSAMLALLEQAGFRLHAHSELPAAQPFVHRPVVNHKDFRLNVFAFRGDAFGEQCV